ncbi:hypothetical protein DICPUDRAFT_148530 [Dictyostelium purpureum]|uniref:ABC transporter B family protein n=1 Tax=Dictyostelium purpureum TaxID=5786 RepID=F0ZBC9_DICPU|nr:uncharacterized protein DICPUDRAFT_148530 [Dictyostelium purpureum]EGC38752.1 hypothetical protein DICPUDRAFT_148530 [Dictyostelium purpureum]|eukprot:XP_003284743.1 hypothetical protein DICPUDRAFT_148530 [Dictyostelium purpureum]
MGKKSVYKSNDDDIESQSLLESYDDKKERKQQSVSDQEYGMKNANREFILPKKKTINEEEEEEEEDIKETVFFNYQLDKTKRKSIRTFIQIISLVVLLGYIISINALYFSTPARSIIFYPTNTTSNSNSGSAGTLTSSEMESQIANSFNMSYFYYYSSFDILLLSYFLSLFWLLLIFSDNYIYHVVSYIISIIALAYTSTKAYFTVTNITKLEQSIRNATSTTTFDIPTNSPIFESSIAREITIVLVLVGIPLIVIFLLLHIITIQLSYRSSRRRAQREKEFFDQENEKKRLNKKVTVKHSNLKRLIQLSRPELPIILSAMVALVISSLTSLAMPYMFGQIVEVIATTHDFNALNRATLSIVIIFIIGSVATLIRSWLFYLAGQKFVARIRRNLFAAIVTQEVAFFDQNRTGELVSRLSSDSQVIQNSVTVNVSMLFRYTIQIIGGIILLFITNWKLTLLMLSIVPVLAIATVFYGKKIKQLGKQFQDELAKSSTTGEEVLSNIRVVRSFSKEQKFIDLYSKDINGSYLVGKSLAVATGVFSGIVFLVAQLAIALIVWYGAVQVLKGSLSTGSLTSFLLYTLSLAMALAFVSSLMTDFLRAIGSSDRIFELFDRVPAIPTSGGKVLDNAVGELELKDVEFSYPSRPNERILKGINLKLKTGRVTSLVGPSGQGKSTILSMVERFYDPDNGTITLDGVDIKELDPVWYRGIIGYVSQEPVLFACSIKENIMFGNPNATMEQVIDAAKKANAHSFIEEFEHGYDTLLNERGISLSGGQKQRIAIARALILDPKVLLLDESTSALDAVSEKLVQEAIDRLMFNRTVVVIAHRLSTVINSDVIVVIDKGEIKESGTHQELLSNPDGIYHNLVKRQLSTN